MSEDTARVNGEGTAQEPGPAPEHPLQSQVNRVTQLANRVGTMLNTAQEAFQEFTLETALLFQSLTEAKETNVNRPTDSPSAQAKA